MVDYKLVGTFQLPQNTSFNLKHTGQPLTFGNSPAWAERYGGRGGEVRKGRGEGEEEGRKGERGESGGREGGGEGN